MGDVQVAYVKMKFLLAVHNYHQISLTIDPGLQQVKKLATHDRYSPIQTNHARKLGVMGAGGVGEGVQQCFFYVMHSNYKLLDKCIKPR